MSSLSSRTPFVQGAPVYPTPHFSSSQAPSPYHAASYAPQPAASPYPYYASSYAPSAPAASYAPQPAASPYPYYAPSAPAASYAPQPAASPHPYYAPPAFPYAPASAPSFHYSAPSPMHPASTPQFSGTVGFQPYSFAEEGVLSLSLRNSVKLLTPEAFTNRLIDETIKKLPLEDEMSLSIHSEKAFEARLKLCEKVTQEIEQLPTLDAAHKREHERRFRDAMMFHLIALEAHQLGQSSLAASGRIPEYIENLPSKLIRFETKAGEFARSSTDHMRGLLTAIFSKIHQHIQEHVEAYIIPRKPIAEQVARCNLIIKEILGARCSPSIPNAAKTLEFLNRQALTDFLIEKHAPSFAEAFKEGTLEPDDLDLMLCQLHNFSMSEGLCSNPDLHITFIEKAFGTTDMEKLSEKIIAQAQPEKKRIVALEPIQKLWDHLFVNNSTIPQQQEKEAQQIEAKKQAQKRVIDWLTRIMNPSHTLYPQTPSTDVSYPHFSFSGGIFTEETYKEIN